VRGEDSRTLPVPEMSVGRNTLWVFVSNLVRVGLTIATSVVLTRALGVSGRGEFALFTATAGVLSLILGWGLDSAIRYFVAKGPLDASSVAASLTVYLLALGPPLFLVVRGNDVFLSNQFLLPWSIQTPAVEGLLVCAVVASVGFSGTAALLAGKMDFTPLNLVSVGLAFASLLVYGVMFAAKVWGWFEVDTVVVLTAHTGLMTTQLGFLVLLSWRRLGVRLPAALIRRPMLIRMIRYGSIAHLATLLQFLNYRVDYWIVQHFRGDEGLGLYSLASSLAVMLWMLPRAAASVLLPATAASDVGASAAHAARMSRISVAVGALLVVPIVPSARWWITLLFGAEFADSSTPFLILLTGCIPFIASIVLASSLAGSDRLDINLRASGAGLMATIALDILLIPKFGLEGAAIASATSYLITTGMVVVGYSRMHGIPIHQYLVPTRSDLSYVTDGIRRVLR